MRIINYHLAFAMLLALAVGCGKNPTVSGKVTFPDGTPFTEGKVVFETETFYASGPIQSDGTYVMGSSNPGDGVPRGTYQVSIQDVVKPNLVFRPGSFAPTAVTPASSPIDPRFFSGNTSGLSCEVKGRTTYNITVEAPQ